MHVSIKHRGTLDYLDYLCYWDYITYFKNFKSYTMNKEEQTFKVVSFDMKNWGLIEACIHVPPFDDVKEDFFMLLDSEKIYKDHGVHSVTVNKVRPYHPENDEDKHVSYDDFWEQKDFKGERLEAIEAYLQENFFAPVFHQTLWVQKNAYK